MWEVDCGVIRNAFGDPASLFSVQLCGRLKLFESKNCFVFLFSFLLAMIEIAADAVETFMLLFRNLGCF